MRGEIALHTVISKSRHILNAVAYLRSICFKIASKISNSFCDVFFHRDVI